MNAADVAWLIGTAGTVVAVAIICVTVIILNSDWLR